MLRELYLRSTEFVVQIFVPNPIVIWRIKKLLQKSMYI